MLRRRRRVRRAIRSVNDAVAAGNADEAKNLLVAAYKSIDQAAAKQRLSQERCGTQEVASCQEGKCAGTVSIKTPFHTGWRFFVVRFSVFSDNLFEM